MKDRPEAIQEFTTLVAAHDLTYQRLNEVDPEKYLAGYREWSLLMRFAKDHLTYPVARRIWNANVCFLFNRQQLRELNFWPADPPKWREPLQWT